MTKKKENKIEINDYEPRILAFLCNWCSYAGADLAGVSRLQMPSTVRNIRVMCSGRIKPLFLIKALLGGADGVLMAGCHPGDCHYATGNYKARRRFAITQTVLKSLGFEHDRIRLSWISASEGPRYQQVMSEFTEKVKSAGPNQTKYEMFL
jgi:F420-non-reducing hydrogenase iron-sulfur subunit